MKSVDHNIRRGSQLRLQQGAPSLDQHQGLVHDHHRWRQHLFIEHHVIPSLPYCPRCACTYKLPFVFFSTTNSTRNWAKLVGDFSQPSVLPKKDHRMTAMGHWKRIWSVISNLSQMARSSRPDHFFSSVESLIEFWMKIYVVINCVSLTHHLKSSICIWN